MTPVLHQRISDLLSSTRVVLFMKGTPQAPRCGFSAKAVGLLSSVAPDFLGVDVLADEELRQGIKEFGQWPTLPQVYVDGELLGGSDILAQLFNSGELHRQLGVAQPDRTPPTIEISAAAAQAIRAGMADDPALALHLTIDARWQAQFQLAPAGDEIVASANGIMLHMDAQTAQRARGLRIDWVDSLQGSGLSVHLPAAPPPVQQLSVEELRARLSQGDIRVLDVRNASDRERAPFVAAEILDASSRARLGVELPKQQALAFLCHFGNSSRAEAEQFRLLGFSEVYNIEGGIDAWSQRIDPGVPRY